MTVFSSFDLQHLGSTLVQAARQQILPRFGNLADLEVRRKTSAFDIVTEADTAAELAISDALRRRFPDCLVVGEEASEQDPTLLQRIASAELCFLIDPLDGTRNFASGVPLFGAMAAAVEYGEIVASATHDPVCGTIASALRGSGAMLADRSGSSRRLRVAEPAALLEMEGIAGTRFLPEPQRSRVSANLSRLGVSNWFRCAAHEYVLAASGHCHFLFYNRLMPWDHAAGWLLHREAGGYSAHFDGTSYEPSHTSGGLRCAPDRDTWVQIRDALLSY